MVPPIRIGVLGSPEGWAVRDLTRSADILKNVSILPLSFETLRVDSREELSVFADRAFAGSESPTESSSISLKDLDALIIRTMPLGSLEQIIFRMNALSVAEQLGVPVINSTRCLEICIDKWLTLQKLRLAGLCTPKTVCCQTRDESMEAWHALGEDCVVKPIFGGEGRGMVRVTDRDMAWRVFGTLVQLHAVHYIQEFVPNRGYDLRLLVVGESLYSVRREARGNWRTNASQGGKVVPIEATFEQADMAFRAARVVGGFMVGVDLIESLDGQRMVLEVNGVPGWKSTAQAVDHDIASSFLKHVVDRIQ